MWAGRVYELELAAEHLMDRLRRHQRTAFVAVNPRPEQRVQKMGTFLARLADTRPG
jgi:hypothetical protein